MYSPLSAFIVLCLSSAPGPAAEPAAPPSAEPARALEAELGTGAGLFFGPHAFDDTDWDGTSLASASSARFLLGGFTVDGGLFSLLPLERGGPGASTALTARLGYTGTRWSVVAGATVGVQYTADPLLQVLPSVRGIYRVGPVTLDAGLFDAHGQVPAHVGATYGLVGLAYVFPVGGRARVDIPLVPRAGLRVEGFVFQDGDARTSLVSVGIVGRPTAAARTGDAS
ncbi:hypothetical protein HPC49_38125 [Pyxidicoccus fallax]|uniref:Outer membrane protein beta-barrel domain-containing protein n=1 Tax=Pyxidicoccus fallax TaxID=394095 RepID=A0A848LKK7_9BACT|nr:hypothetical protein [Pyxidicoccus fallax]NMO18305.1 hypothetical protein [Pyxidicoccus fallax]NPC84019.1 hypothetical protein [Pyxidicoccus fallax]